MSGEQIKPGYKRTEVGVMPEDWGLLPIGTFCRCFSGGTPSTGNRAYYGGEIPWITSSDLNSVRISSVDGRITNAGLKNSSAKLVKPGTLLFALYGATAGVCGVTSIEGAINQAVLAIEPNGVNGEYLFQLLQYKKDHNVKTYTQGGQPNFSGEIVKKFQVPVPTLSEQTSIATVLLDVEALLAKLDQVIAKKRDLKQATMQKLLTGQSRLPGFSGEWKMKRLGSLGTTYGGLTGKTKDDFGHGDARYIPFMNVMTDTVIDPDWLERVDVDPGEAQNIAKKGDLFFNGSSETPEEVGYCSVLLEDIPNLYLNSFCFGFRFNPESMVDGLFFAYWFRCEQGRKAMSVLAQGATRYNISKSAFLELKIPQPSADEQAAIATALSDLDAELATLETRRDKTRALKQGMMQELLTGRVRLIESI